MWLNLRSCGSEQRLVEKLFGDREFASWVQGDHRLHLFLDSLDECLLRVDTVAPILVDKLQDCPVERLSLRVACRTAEWPMLLEEGLRQLWPEGGFEAYELAPLRRIDVSAAATANELDPEAFLQAVEEAEAVPLAIKPVTLDFLMGIYGATGGIPTRQADLYLEGCRWLCEERSRNRVTSRRIDELAPDQRLAVAARMAAVTIFSNKYAVWSGPQQAVPEKEDADVARDDGGRGNRAAAHTFGYRRDRLLGSHRGRTLQPDVLGHAWRRGSRAYEGPLRRARAVSRRAQRRASSIG